MEPAKLFTDIVTEAPNAEFLNQLHLIKKAAKGKAAQVIIDTVLKGGVYRPTTPTGYKLYRGLHWARMNPWKSGLLAGAGVGAGYGAAKTIGKRINQETAGGVQDDPVVKALSNPSKMNDAQKLNTGIGAAAGLAGGAGIYAALSKVPGLKRRKLLNALLATVGGGAIGYAGWRAADNYQKA